MNKPLEVYQWLVPVIASYYIFRTFRQYANGKYSPRNTVIWTCFWLAIMTLALIPDTVATSIAKGLGFKDHINAIIFVALGLLFLMIFYLSAALNRVENKITDLVRRLALEKAALAVKENTSTPKKKVTKKYVSKKLSKKK